jgi:hypothetical protein
LAGSTLDKKLENKNYGNDCRHDKQPNFSSTHPEHGADVFGDLKIKIIGNNAQGFFRSDEFEHPPFGNKIQGGSQNRHTPE